MYEQGDDQEQLPDILEEHVQEQRIVPFLGDNLGAAISPKGAIYVTLPGMCAALGLNVKGQMQRIRRSATLDKGLRLIPLKTKGGTQRVNCLRVDKVALWLAGVQTSQIKPKFRGKIEAYQEELAPLATQVFMRVMGIEAAPIQTADRDIASMAEQYDTLINVALDVQAHMTAMGALPEQINAMRWQLDQAMELLESIAGDNAETHQTLEKIKTKTAGLTPAQARQVQEQISHMVAVTEGTSSALRYATIYGRIKHRFRVSSYSQIADTRFEELLQFLRDELQRATEGQEPEQGSLFS